MTLQSAEQVSLELLIFVHQRLNRNMPSCAGRGFAAIPDALRLQLVVTQVDVNVRELFCFGRCADGPNVRLAPGGRFGRGVVLADVSGDRGGDCYFGCV